jgi:hypothetical protein
MCLSHMLIRISFAKKSTYQHGEDETCRLIKHLQFFTLKFFFLMITRLVYLHSSRFVQTHFKTTVLMTVTSRIHISPILYVLFSAHEWHWEPDTLTSLLCNQYEASYFKYWGCDTVLRGQYYRKFQEAVIEGHGAMVECWLPGGNRRNSEENVLLCHFIQEESHIKSPEI